MINVRICPKCLKVFGSVFDQYCNLDGTKTLDSDTEEAKETVKRLRKKLKEEEDLHERRDD